MRPLRVEQDRHWEEAELVWGEGLAVGMWAKGGKGWVSLWAAPVASAASGRAVQGRQRRPAGLSTPERSEPPGARSASPTYPRAIGTEPRAKRVMEGGPGGTIPARRGRFVLALRAPYALRASGQGRGTLRPAHAL